MTTSIYPLGFAYSYPLVHRSRTDLREDSQVIDTPRRSLANANGARGCLGRSERLTVADGIIGCPIMMAHLRKPRPFFKAIGLARAAIEDVLGDGKGELSPFQRAQ